MDEQKWVDILVLGWERGRCTRSVNTKPRMDPGPDTKCLLKDDRSICWTAFGVRNDGPPGPWARRTLGGRASFYVTTWMSVWMAAILPQGLVRFYAIMYVVFVLRVLRLPITVVMLQPW